MKRKIFIGDIHGCYKELMLLLEKLEYKKNEDQLYFVGDMINKGPSSKQVLDFAITESIKCVRGNHEQGFINYLEKGEYKNFKPFIKIKLELGDELPIYLNYLKSLPFYIEEDDFILLHAGVSPLHHDDISKESQKVLTYIRTWDGKGVDLHNKNDPAWFSLYKNEKLIIYGHWASMGLNVKENSVGLDSGCVYGKQLSALILPSLKVVQVDALSSYAEMITQDIN